MTRNDAEQLRAVERLTDDIAAMLHYRGKALHPRTHDKARGGPCDECIESARQAIEFVKTFAVGGYR